MEPEVAEICAFCVGLIPPKEEHSRPRPHHLNVGCLEQSSQSCAICNILLRDWSLQEAQKHFPDMDKETYESIPLTVRLKEMQVTRPGSGVSWVMLEVLFFARGYSFTDFISITSCSSDGG